MVAILQTGSHIEMIWTLQFASSSLLFYIMKHIIPKHCINRLLNLKQDALHYIRWRPFWKLGATLKRSEHSNSSYNINCAFYILKTHNFLSILYFSTICCHFKEIKQYFRIAQWWPYSNNGGHIEILRDPRNFPGGWHLSSICTKYGACIIIWNIF